MSVLHLVPCMLRSLIYNSENCATLIWTPCGIAVSEHIEGAFYPSSMPSSTIQ